MVIISMIGWSGVALSHPSPNATCEQSERTADVSHKIGLSTESSAFIKRKKQKSGSKMKRHNKSMGRKFKRKNDDSLRDRLP